MTREEFTFCQRGHIEQDRAMINENLLKGGISMSSVNIEEFYAVKKCAPGGENESIVAYYQYESDAIETAFCLYCADKDNVYYVKALVLNK